MAVNIVFDFGAVLFTWRPDVLVAALFPSEAPTAAAVRQLATDIFHHDDWRAFDGGTMQLPAVIERTARRLNLPYQALDGLMTSVPEHLVPIPETVVLLARLNRRRERHGDVRLYFLSNMPAPFARVLEQRHAFLSWFDGGVFSGDVKLTKPQPEIFQLLQSRYALDPARTMFIDDHPANVEAARLHGWQAIQFESAAQLAPHMAAHLW